MSLRAFLFLFVAGVIALLAFAAPGQTNANAQKEDPSELQIYSFPTQIGTVARRIFHSPAGRMSKEIFYTAPKLTRQRPSEADLKIQSVHLYRYDSTGVLVELESRGPDARVTETKRLDYDERRELVHSSTFGPDGILRAEIFSRGNRKTTTVSYDVTGKRRLTIRGEVRADADLPDGWGESVQGLACGIVLSKTNGALADLEVHLNIRNTGDGRSSIQELPDGIMVLRDAQAKEIPESSAHVQAREKSLLPATQLYGQSPAPGEAGFLYPAWEIKDRFPQLAPGRYTLSVRLPVPELNLRLESNPVTFVVE